VNISHVLQMCNQSSWLYCHSNPSIVPFLFPGPEFDGFFVIMIELLLAIKMPSVSQDQLGLS
jgi:hypothetical protein